MFDFWRLFGGGPEDRDDVKPDPAIFQAEPAEVALGGFGDSLDFDFIDRFGGRGAIVASACFYFDEYERVVVGHDQVDFAKVVGVSAVDRDPPLAQ